jgi:hypothetical protein
MKNLVNSTLRKIPTRLLVDFLLYDDVDNFDEEFPLTHLHICVTESNEADCDSDEVLWKVWEFIDYQTNEKCWVKFEGMSNSYSQTFQLKSWGFVEQKTIVAWVEI